MCGTDSARGLFPVNLRRLVPARLVRQECAIRSAALRGNPRRGAFPTFGPETESHQTSRLARVLRSCANRSEFRARLSVSKMRSCTYPIDIWLSRCRDIRRPSPTESFTNGRVTCDPAMVSGGDGTVPF